MLPLLGLARPRAALAQDNEPGQPIEIKRDAAREQFDRGVGLVKKNALSAALAAFLKSREIFPSRAATSNAAWCLRKLERFDEALDMYEALLREFKNLPADERAAAQQAVAELRELVGTLEIKGGVAGAVIAIDGRDRGEYPSVDALRVGAGAHVVRLYKDGYEPFETTVDVAGGQTARVRAHLARLAESGRLQVIEKNGKHLDVLLDNVRVGTTPWEASVAVGPHTVVLRGDNGFGTQPVRVPVQAQTNTPLTLAAEELTSSLLVQVVPPGASVALDGVPVGRGLWEGRLRAGSHRVEVGAEGFLPETRETALTAGDRRTLLVELRRDPSARIWQQPSKIVVDAAVAFDVPLAYGGDVEGGCGAGCTRTPGVGLLALLHGTYELPSGIGFGIAVGYARVAESLSGRATSVRPVGLAPVAGTVSDSLEASGLLAGGTVGARFGARFPITLRLGGGVFVGSARDERQGSFGQGAAAVAVAPRASATTPAPSTSTPRSASRSRPRAPSSSASASTSSRCSSSARPSGTTRSS